MRVRMKIKCKNPNCEEEFVLTRSNKVYCCGICRSEHYRLVNIKKLQEEQKLRKGNRNNEQVLRDLFSRLPMNKEDSGAVNLSQETLMGAGYNFDFSGMLIMVNIDGKKISCFRYSDMLLYSHPNNKGRYLIRNNYGIDRE